MRYIGQSRFASYKAGGSGAAHRRRRLPMLRIRKRPGPVRINTSALGRASIRLWAAKFVEAWINGLAFIAFTLLQGQGWPDVIGELHVIELVPFLAILWI